MATFRVKTGHGEYTTVSATGVDWPEHEGDALVFRNQGREVVGYFNGRMVEYVVKTNQPGQTEDSDGA